MRLSYLTFFSSTHSDALCPPLIHFFVLGLLFASAFAAFLPSFLLLFLLSLSFTFTRSPFAQQLLCYPFPAMASDHGPRPVEALPRNATAAAFANRGIHSQRQPEASAPNSFLGSPSFPHPFSPSHVLSTSVREQSLALGNLELAQSSPSSPATSSHQEHLPWASNSGSSAIPGPDRIDRQFQPPAKDTGHRNAGDRSPPSGLSLLLKTKGQGGSNSKPGTGSNHDPMSLGSGTAATGIGSTTTLPKVSPESD